jgi:hypothetical protein
MIKLKTNKTLTIRPGGKLQIKRIRIKLKKNIWQIFIKKLNWNKTFKKRPGKKIKSIRIETKIQKIKRDKVYMTYYNWRTKLKLKNNFIKRPGKKS